MRYKIRTYNGQGTLFQQLPALASLIHSFFNDFVMKRQVNLISKAVKRNFRLHCVV